MKLYLNYEYFKKPRWQIKESNVTNENIYFNRRDFLQKSSIYLGSSAISYNYLGNDGTASQNNINNLKFIKNKKYQKFQKLLKNLSTKYNNFLNLIHKKYLERIPKFRY